MVVFDAGNNREWNAGPDIGWGTGRYGVVYDGNIGDIYNSGTGNITQNGLATLTDGDIIAAALNLDASPATVQFYKNNATIGTAENLNASASGIWGFATNSNTNWTWYLNAGADSSFSGQKTAQGNEDGNGKGDFYYSPPAGYLAMCTNNLADPSIKLSGENFNTVLYTGNGSTQSITGVGFQPDTVWLKDRTTAESPHLYDAIRGATKTLLTNATQAEFTGADRLTAFDSDGFSLGSNDGVNKNTDALVSWNWKANGSGSANTDGSISSTVSANATAGFSIVSYTGTNTAGTIGHGLSVAPDMIILKERSGTAQWPVGCLQDPMNWTDYMALDKANNYGDFNYWNDTTPTASVFSISSDGDVNEQDATYIAYCFHSVNSYSKIGHYYGNGVTANYGGPFIFTGFRPAFILIKCMDDSSTNWMMFDNLREGYNKDNDRLLANDNLAEDTTDFIYIISNGFKLISTHSDVGTNNSRYLFYAVAKSPFKYANAR